MTVAVPILCKASRIRVYPRLSNAARERTIRALSYFGWRYTFPLSFSARCCLADCADSRLSSSWNSSSPPCLCLKKLLSSHARASVPEHNRRATAQRIQPFCTGFRGITLETDLENGSYAEFVTTKFEEWNGSTFRVYIISGSDCIIYFA
jgi:hypothetical protein